MVHMRKSELYYSVIDHLKKWDKLKFGEKDASSDVSES